MSTLADSIRAELRAAADPQRAPGMQAYMRSAMPYLGVPVPQVRKIARSCVQREPPGTATQIGEVAAELWRGADFREERYAAAALLTVPPARGALELLDLHREMIVTGAWWDHVDEASHRIGELLAAHRAAMTPVVRAWQTDPDRWLRRVSVICQLGAKRDTDTELLAEAIEANVADRDFFLRKAIGWALRQYARTDPDWVLAFLAEHPALSPLSRREAAKHL